jgi:formate hydrogenlyase subunit 3/multisubunit Na+/H+ antiporter MnhD subunit
MRTIQILNQDTLVLPLIFFIIACTFDVVYRLAQQTDLKAVVAYSSVLHVNLLMLLVLLSPTTLNLGLILYIWGHSYTSAGLFYAVHLIERCYNSRSSFEISGLYNTNQAIGLVCIAAVVSCLEFPLNFYF